MSEITDRVKIWNSFFKLVWKEAKSVHELSSGSPSSKEFNPVGGTLENEQFHILATLVLCNLAIEARANHLIEELVEEGKISRKVGEAARRLPPQHKWFLLPALARAPKTLEDDRPPHQAIAQICSLRNDLLHVDYDKLKQRLPKSGDALSLFSNFVAAMEDMNVVLGRIANARKDVLEIGKF